MYHVFLASRICYYLEKTFPLLLQVGSEMYNVFLIIWFCSDLKKPSFFRYRILVMFLSFSIANYSFPLCLFSLNISMLIDLLIISNLLIIFLLKTRSILFNLCSLNTTLRIFPYISRRIVDKVFFAIFFIDKNHCEVFF